MVKQKTPNPTPDQESENIDDLIPLYGLPEEENPDAHDCRANANEYGICTVCGAIIHGSIADYELHGYDPPESGI